MEKRSWSEDNAQAWTGVVGIVVGVGLFIVAPVVLVGCIVSVFF